MVVGRQLLTCSYAHEIRSQYERLCDDWRTCERQGMAGWFPSLMRIPGIRQGHFAVRVAFPPALWHLLGQKRNATLAAKIHKAPSPRQTGRRCQANLQGLHRLATELAW